MADISALLSQCIHQSHSNKAFHPTPDDATNRPKSIAYAVKETREFKGDSPIQVLAYEHLGIDFFARSFRNFPKKPYAPLRDYVEEHFKNFTYAFDHVISDFNALPKAWYADALNKPLCGLSEGGLDIQINFISSLPYFPFHQGLFSKRELKRAFESKVRRTDQFDIFAARGFPKSPWDQDDMLASYCYGILYPEVWAGIWAWQFTSSQMMAALYDTSGEMLDTLPKQWLSTYRHFADMLSRVLVKPLFPIFLLPGLATQPCETAQDITRGLIHSFSKGTFGSIARNDDGGELKFACPFNGTGTRLLMLELENGLRALPAFILKMRDDECAKSLLDEIREQLAAHVLNRCNKRTVKRFMRSARGQQFRESLDLNNQNMLLQRFKMR